jgi:hypothetical protein
MKTGRGLLIAIVAAIAPTMFSWLAAAEAPYTIPVKILADDREPTVQRLWEKRYRDRVAAASDIIERCCNVRFKVVAVATWSSNNDIHDLGQLMDEFERKVRPEPARLVIGFTGQYQSLKGDTHMGGARGPFRSHVLIREWGRQITEPERLEILVHELGHYLGAAHSAEHQSVMRPDVSDRQSRMRSFQISFDASNAEALRLICAEMRQRPLVHLAQISPASKDRLRTLYRSLAGALPKDPAAPRYLAMLDQSLGTAGAPSEHLQAVLAGARTVARAVTEAAADNRRLLEKPPELAPGDFRLSGDELTELYVRRAAAAAKRLPKDVGPAALLLGLGVAMDDSPLLPSVPIVSVFWKQIEPESARATRLAVIGKPAMRGRHDWAQHFAVSAALTVLFGPKNAENIGIVKEVSDSRGGSGFSFADLSADLAGIQFAAVVGDGRVSLFRLESAFLVRDFLPDAGGLKEGIAWDDFVQSYGFPPDARLAKERESLRERVLAMPGYKPSMETMLRKRPPASPELPPPSTRKSPAVTLP